jgi:hypothetical protein
VGVEPTAEQSAECAALAGEEETPSAVTPITTPPLLATSTDVTPQVTASPTAQASVDDDDDGANTGVIVGGIVVGVVVVVIVAGGVVLWLRRTLE